jgi:inosose dehydratase
MSHLSLSRRQLLGLTAASFAATLVSPRFSFAAARSGLNLGIQMYSLRGYQVNEALVHAKALGFTHVEFYSGMFETNSSAEQIASMKKQVSDLGLTISAHGVNRFTKDAAANRAIFEFAKNAGIGILSADPDPDSFSSLDELVKEYGVKIAIHNHGPGHRYNKAVDVLHAIEGHDERIGACADLGH